MTLFSRRRLIQRSGAGFGLVGMAGALQAAGAISNKTSLGEKDSDAFSTLHHPARAKRVIFLFQNGGPSHVDTFDPKPKLREHQGESPADDIAGKNRAGGFMASPFQFAPRGESGVVMSELFPHLSRHADDLTVIRSMHTDVPNHEPGLLLMQSGHQQPTRPSIGSWLSYGLGTENENLPSYVAISPGLPVVGPQLWSSSFLPGQHQGIEIDTNQTEVEKLIANIRHPHLDRTAQRRQLELVRQLNQQHPRKSTGRFSARRAHPSDGTRVSDAIASLGGV